ncbi:MULTISPECIES: pyroglutamyl-peptidase I [Pontibacillus]|uniref:Pyrrolidone-carboxylate peptidase n=1 Tax=Pontibacillus chungwhensis TaxID=265426 RepID=A0ABY8UYW1_9BACI|nr:MULTISPECIES: pyroglutamyl-peptidase I [Pontibacillus]MCD5323985.1 pyroglutamyl-peptidase I [Pontibacillus sp. HN14]WIF97951.1 pyroglutamyl-peptidase I [Pontibacillus chungwhensis]
MKKLLLTGFEPFLDFPVNPTMKIVEELDGQIINGYTIVGKILTVEFGRSGEQLVQHIEETKPDTVISLGLAGGRYKITPERVAINCNDGDADNSGRVPRDEWIEEGGPDAIFSTLPIRNMVNRLAEQELPADISNTAGTYLCNNVMYRALFYIQSHQLNTKAGFIHIPASHELAIQHKRIPSWSHRDLLEGIKTCIDSLE